MVYPSHSFCTSCGQGASMAIAFDNAHSKGTTRCQMVVRVFRRACILYALGLMVSNNDKTPKTVRIMGVLQRFGVSFLVVGAILVLIPQRERDTMADVTEPRST